MSVRAWLTAEGAAMGQRERAGDLVHVRLCHTLKLRLSLGQ